MPNEIPAKVATTDETEKKILEDEAAELEKVDSSSSANKDKEVAETCQQSDEQHCIQTEVDTNHLAEPSGNAVGSDESVSAKPKAKNKKMSITIPKRRKVGKGKKKSDTSETKEAVSSTDQQTATAIDDTPDKHSFFNFSRLSSSKSKSTEIEKKDETATTQTKAKQKKTARNSLLTDFFPVRRSDRRSKADLEKMEKNKLEDKILSGCEDGLKVVDIDGKGRGVISTKPFKRGDFIVEYAGDLITLGEAQAKEDRYSQNPDVGCYMYYFKFNNKNYCVDATAESGKLGRLLNHSKSGNCKTKVVGIGDKPYLILVAAKDIDKNEELLYDYGDRSKEAIAAHPWLAM